MKAKWAWMEKISWRSLVGRLFYLLCLAVLAPYFLMHVSMLGGGIASLAMSYASRVVQEAPADRILPENEGKRIRLRGYVRTEDVIELPKWGIRIPAIELVCRTNVPQYSGSATASRLYLGAYRLDEHMRPPYYQTEERYRDTPGSHPEWMKPLPRAAVQSLPAEVQGIEWEEDDHTLKMMGTLHGRRVFAHFRYYPSQSPQEMYLLGLQKGNQLVKYECFDSADDWAREHYDTPPMTAWALLAVLIYLPVSYVMTLLFLSCLRRVRGGSPALSIWVAALLVTVWSVAAACGVFMAYRIMQAPEETSHTYFSAMLPLLLAVAGIYLHVRLVRGRGKSTSSCRRG